MGEAGETVIRVVDVTKHYEEGLVKALNGVSFEVKQAEFLAVTGPSGSGKTTLLHLLGALDLPTSGRVEILGRDLAQVEDLDRLRGRTIGFVFQLHHLIPNLSLWENVALPAHPLGVSRKERRRKATEMLGRVGLDHRVGFLPVKCSGGERQRAAVARALINDPDIILADEPTGSVDTTTGNRILEVFDTLGKEHGTTRVIITHNNAIARRADRTVRIVDGVLAEPGRETAETASGGEAESGE